jgi:hypothetical protein
MILKKSLIFQSLFIFRTEMASIMTEAKTNGYSAEDEVVAVVQCM